MREYKYRRIGIAAACSAGQLALTCALCIIIYEQTTCRHPDSAIYKIVISGYSVSSGALLDKSELVAVDNYPFILHRGDAAGQKAVGTEISENETRPGLG